MPVTPQIFSIMLYLTLHIQLTYYNIKVAKIDHVLEIGFNMRLKGYPLSLLWKIVILLMSLTLISACNTAESEAGTTEGLRTWLLVSEPNIPLPAGQPVEVRSRSEDVDHGISHVELYLVQFQTETGDVVNDEILIRSDAASFAQTGFTASQIFTPKQAGSYVIQVKGYNQIGESVKSNTISFEVTQAE